MRKFMWCLALVGSAAISFTLVNAQERQDQIKQQPPVQQTEPAQPTSGGVERSVGLLKYDSTRPRANSAQQTPQLKNYHKELFGTESPNAKTQTPRPLAQQSPFDGKKIGRSLNAAPEKQPRSLGVIPAGFSEEEGSPNQIIQTSAKQTAAAKGAALLVLPNSDSPGRAAPRAVTPATKRAVETNFSKESAHVVAEWRALTDINVGQPCELELHVSNKGQVKASNITVEAFFPASVRLTSAVPEPKAATDFVSWNFPSLDAGQKQIIRIKMVPSARGDALANANVRFTTASSLVLAVKEPMLKLALTGPKQVMIGESAPHVVTVSNPGTGVAHNVSIEVAIPAGFEHSRGKRLKMDIGSLSPKESRTVRLSLVSKAGGKQTVTVIGKSGTELSKTASSVVSVLAPSLAIAVDGPSLRYIGRDARYAVTVTNNGQAMTNNVRTMYAVPKGFDFVSATRGGKFDSKNRTVTWFVGSIDASKQVELSLRLRPTQLGDFAHVARASSEHGAAANGQTTTKIEGTASLELKVADLDDPVEIGRETGYQITVRNNGSKEAKNVGLSIELPNGVKLVRANGPSQHIAESGLVVFKSMPALAPGKTATFQVMITGKEEGNQRVRARLTSSSIREPLTVEEITRFYAD
jgi:uncharacterized repeat protein (TIGR01451 family)